MVKKLSFLLTDKTWKSLLLKVLFFGLGLFGVYFFDFSFPVIFVFSILVGWFYFSQLPERFHFRISFLVLVLAAVFSLRFFGSSFYLAFLGCLVFSYLFYLLLGLPALVFRNRQPVYLLFNTGLFLAIFLLFFGADKLKYFLTINFLLFLVVFFLFKECFDFLRSAVHNSLFIVHNPGFVSLVFAFLSLELFWAISLLPIGFINLAVLETLFVFLTRDFTLAYFSGRLDRRFLIYHFVVFVVLISLIFTVSRWSI
ncbi:MAG: hypothetical protein AAB404_01615 [Patescibacteria group bacterium]